MINIWSWDQIMVTKSVFVFLKKDLRVSVMLDKMSIYIFYEMSAINYFRNEFQARKIQILSCKFQNFKIISFKLYVLALVLQKNAKQLRNIHYTTSKIILKLISEQSLTNIMAIDHQSIFIELNILLQYSYHTLHTIRQKNFNLNLPCIPCKFLLEFRSLV